VAYFEALYRDQLGETEEKYEKPQSLEPVTLSRIELDTFSIHVWSVNLASFQNESYVFNPSEP
jgi:hypothetical protein